MSSEQPPPPGWYPDPSREADLRAWDGNAWTDQVRNVARARRPESPGVAGADGAQRAAQVALTTREGISVADANANDAPPVGVDVATDQKGITPLSDALPRSRAATATSGSPGAPQDHAGTSQTTTGQGPARRSQKWNSSNAIVAVLLGIFLAAGLWEVVTGESSGNGNPDRFAGSSPVSVATTTTVAARAQAVSCTDQIGAVTVVQFLRTSKFPVSVPHTAPRSGTASGVATGAGNVVTAAPTAACNATLFRDARAAGLNQVAIYANAADASRAALSTPAPAAIAVDRIVLRLVQPLAPYRGAYQTAIAKLLASAHPAGG
jgi:hypothetical protein